ncbi:MAG: RDD family protein [Panacagrimonas sp.]
MSNLVIPAPLWRRLIAAVYDGLLLLGLWMAGALLDLLIRDQLLGLPRHWLWLQGLFFVIGLGFFGWSWTRGGQTLGMRVWRLHVRRLDGGVLRWPIATLRYSTMLATWMAATLPLLLLIPRYAAQPTMVTMAVAAGLIVLASAVLMLTESRRRALCDWISGTEVVVLPPKN